MNTSRYFKLGLFVLIGIGMLVAAVLVLGAGRLLTKQIHAETLMDESVSGMEVGSPVKYRGVTIGRVTSIAFASDQNGGIRQEQDRIARFVLIDMALDADSFKGMTLAEIHETFHRMADNGLRARVDQQGIGGGVYLGLDFMNPAPAPPERIHERSDALFIPSAPSTMNDVMSAADRLAGDLRQANLPEVVKHVDGLVTSATGTIQHVDQLVQANEAGLGTTLADLRGTARDLHTLVSTQQQDIQAIISDLRRTANNAAAMSDDLKENPSRLLLGGPPPRKTPGE